MSQQQQQQQQQKPKHVVVIGAGVIGLSTAILLQKAGHKVTILAEHFPGPFETMHPQDHIDYSSPWAGAHNRWIPPPPNSSASSQVSREHDLARVTYNQMKSLAERSEFSSVKFMKGVEFIEQPGGEYLSLDGERARELGIEGFRLLSGERGEFPKDGRVTWGCEYMTWCLNPMVYCCFLLRRFVSNGGGILKRRVSRVQEGFALCLGVVDPDWNKHWGSSSGWIRREGGTKGVDAVVNASGVGFGDDPNMFITRGQTCVVAESGGEYPATVTRQNKDGSWTFSVPRGAEGGTVVGGTKEPGNYDPLPCPLSREKLLSRIVETQPGLLDPGKSRLTPVRDIVGRRPTRKGGPRIEGEVLEGKGFVMHAYGMGGRGYELSWGVAEKVAEGVERYFGQGVGASKL